MEKLRVQGGVVTETLKAEGVYAQLGGIGEGTWSGVDAQPSV